MEFGPYQQNDSDEFLTKLLDRLEQGIKHSCKVWNASKSFCASQIGWINATFGGKEVGAKDSPAENGRNGRVRAAACALKPGPLCLPEAACEGHGHD